MLIMLMASIEIVPTFREPWYLTEETVRGYGNTQSGRGDIAPGR